MNHVGQLVFTFFTPDGHVVIKIFSYCNAQVRAICVQSWLCCLLAFIIFFFLLVHWFANQKDFSHWLPISIQHAQLDKNPPTWHLLCRQCRTHRKNLAERHLTMAQLWLNVSQPLDSLVRSARPPWTSNHIAETSLTCYFPQKGSALKHIVPELQIVFE